MTALSEYRGSIACIMTVTEVVSKTALPSLKIQYNLVNLKSSGLEVLFQIISSLNYRELDIKVCNFKYLNYQVFFLSNICFGSFTHSKHVLFKTVIEIVHKYASFSEFIVSKIYFDNQSSNFQSFTVFV